MILEERTNIWSSSDTALVALITVVAFMVYGLIHLLMSVDSEDFKLRTTDFYICCIPFMLWVSLKILYEMMT